MKARRSNNGTSSLPCAAILTALPEEYKSVRGYLTNLREEVHPSGTVYELGDFCPSSGQQWVVALAEIGSGNPEAAFEAERALNHFSPKAAIFIGVAGGLKDVKLGDVVAATKVYGYEAGKAKGKFEPRPSVGESSYSLVQRARAEAKRSGWRKRIESPSKLKPRAFVGAIAAGEKVVASTRSSIYKFIRTSYGDSLAVEMEGRGFLTATHANQGVEALVIRGISDLVDRKQVADAKGSQRVAARNASAFAFEVLSNFAVNTLIKYRMEFEGSITEHQRERLDDLVKFLREVSGDKNLRIVEVRTGSLILILEGSQAGFEHIESLFKAGKLSRVVDLSVHRVSQERRKSAVRNTKQIIKQLEAARAASVRNTQQIIKQLEAERAALENALAAERVRSRRSLRITNRSKLSLAARRRILAARAHVADKAKKEC